MPMQESNAELSEKSGMLQAEKKLLEDEIKRWKARTQVSTPTSSWFSSKEYIFVQRQMCTDVKGNEYSIYFYILYVKYLLLALSLTTVLMVFERKYTAVMFKLSPLHTEKSILFVKAIYCHFPVTL